MSAELRCPPSDYVVDRSTSILALSAHVHRLAGVVSTLRDNGAQYPEIVRAALTLARASTELTTAIVNVVTESDDDTMSQLLTSDRVPHTFES